MSRYTVAYYFKAIIKDMPDEYNTVKQVDAYVRKALRAAVAHAEEASWKMLPMSYEQFCYCWDLDEDKNRFKTMWLLSFRMPLTRPYSLSECLPSFYASFDA